MIFSNTNTSYSIRNSASRLGRCPTRDNRALMSIYLHLLKFIYIGLHFVCLKYTWLLHVAYL